MSAAPGRQCGVALISVLLIVALVSALVYHLVSQHALTIARSQQSLSSSESLAYALGAEEFARQILAENWEDPQGREVDHLEESWAQPLAPFEVERGVLELEIIDLQGRFNLNALADADESALETMRALLGALGLPSGIAELWRSWVTPGDPIAGAGAGDGTYLLADPPYRAAHQMAADPSELRLLHEIDQAHVDALLPHVATLPSTSLQINVNTADALALQALSPALSPSQAESIAGRDRRFESVDEAVGEIPQLDAARGQLSVTSSYFRINAMAEIDGVRTELASMVHRDPEDGSIRLLARDFGRRHVSRNAGRR